MVAVVAEWDARRTLKLTLGNDLVSNPAHSKKNIKRKFIKKKLIPLCTKFKITKTSSTPTTSSE